MALTPKERKAAKLKAREDINKTLDDQGKEFKPEPDFVLALPDGVERWYPEMGENKADEKSKHYFDIIPFWAGKNYPTGKGGTKRGGRNIDINHKENEFAYKLDIWVHNNVGPEYKSVPCLYRNYDEKCPICQRVMDEYRDTEDELEKKKIWGEGSAKRRTIYNVRPLDENQKPLYDDVKVFDISYFHMEEKLKELSVPARGGKIYFADDEEGRTVFFAKIPDETYNFDIIAHEFVSRDYKISDEDTDNSLVLDDYIKRYSFEELVEMDEGRNQEDPDENGDDSKKTTQNEETGDAGMKTKTRTKPSLTSKTEEKDEYAEFKVNGKFVACPDFEGDVDSEDNPFGRNFDAFKNCKDCPASKDCETKQKNMGEDIPY